VAEAAAPIAQVLREERPEVVVTATPDGTYGHPDHVRAHDATVAALEALRSEGWAPASIAMVAFPRGVAALIVHAVLAFGVQPSGWLLREASVTGLPGTAVRFTPLGDLMPRKRAAMLAHRSQLRGRFGLLVRQPLLCRLVFGVERYLVAGSPAGEREAGTLFAHV
jgi:N-acetyl-1-D-myo-inositol-2-amino-2-deoxy-alpha-D-glucopyranoside deacetylase